MSLSDAKRPTDLDASTQAQNVLSPLWGVVLVLAEIAERVSRREAQEPHTGTPCEKSEATPNAA